MNSARQGLPVQDEFSLTMATECFHCPQPQALGPVLQSQPYSSTHQVLCVKEARRGRGAKQVIEVHTVLLEIDRR